MQTVYSIRVYIQSVPLATEPGISLIILPLMRISQQFGALQTRTTDTHYRHTLQTRTTDTHYRHALQTHTTETFLFISHTTNVLLLKFRCNIFTGVRTIKEMPGSVASGTLCIYNILDRVNGIQVVYRPRITVTLLHRSKYRKWFSAYSVVWILQQLREVCDKLTVA
jgi:hypothetical protein